MNAKQILRTGLFLSMVMVLAACAPTSLPQPPPITVEEPTVIPTVPPPAEPTAMPTENPTAAPLPTETSAPAPELSAEQMDQIRDTAESACSVCHSFDRVEKTRKDLAGWQSTISRMIDKGAVLSAEDQLLVAQYLAMTYK